MIDEGEFRHKVQETIEFIARSLDQVDPDLAEYESKPGQLTISFADGTRCILSTQPSVRQLWLAVASRGTAYHFNWVNRADLDPASARSASWPASWLDDRGRGIELFAFLEGYLKEMIGPEFSFSKRG